MLQHFRVPLPGGQHRRAVAVHVRRVGVQALVRQQQLHRRGVPEEAAPHQGRAAVFVGPRGVVHGQQLLHDVSLPEEAPQDQRRVT